MEIKWISKDALRHKFAEWMKSYVLYAPISTGRELAFQLVKEPEEVMLAGYSNTRYPPKGLFLPQSEVLLKYDGILHSVENEEKEKILFAVRPCDVRAMRLLDTAFIDEQNPDEYWKKKRTSTIIISLGCLYPEESCFCTSVGGSPLRAADADILLIEMGDAYCAYVYTEKGEVLFKELPDAEETQLEKVKRLIKEVETPMPPAFPKQKLHDSLLQSFETDFWKGVSQVCLGCGVCTFLCPSCFCFDIVDETLRKERVRNWDSCMFRVYTLEASGHNPRPTRVERTRQRVMHKFVYWVDLIDEMGCTGCGRCVKYCPVNIDIRTIVESALTWEFQGVTR